MKPSGRRALALALALLAAPLAARAQQPASAGAQPAPLPAESLLREGVELRRRGRDDDALELFRRANQAAPSPIAMAQIGLAEQALGRWTAAEEHVRTALAGRDDPWIRQNRDELERALRVIRAHLGAVEVWGPEGAALRVDGRAVGTLPLGAPVWLAPGDVSLELRASGYEPQLRRVHVRAESQSTEVFELRRARGGRDLRWPIGLGTAVAAGVLLLGGSVAFIGREVAVADYNNDPSCPGTDYTPQGESCAGRISTAGTLETLGAVGLVSGGVLAAGALVLLLTAPRGADRDGGAAHASTPAWRCGPLLSGGSGGVLCGAAF